MWLKLTREDNNKQQLYNMDLMQVVIPASGFTMIGTCNDGEFYEVKESLAEIELMLMGSKPSAPDPRERNVIGREPFPMGD